jgi:hypothetical protein
MMIRKGWLMLLAPLGAAALFAQAAVGCQETEKKPDGGSGAATTSTSGQGGATTTTTGQGGDISCGFEAEVHTIPEITSGAVGEGVDVRVEGAVVMSQKFLITKSSSGNCLWGVFVSAPGLSVTEPNSGILVAAYGTPATTEEDGGPAYCPMLDADDPQGDAIPENVQPGDVVNIIGETSYFLLDNCAEEPDGAEVAARQLGYVCSFEVVNHTTPPEPALITGADVARLGSPSIADQTFHDQWGGVKVRVENVMASADPVVGDYGIILLDDVNLEVGDKIYYQGYSDNLCHDGPVYDSPPVTFTAIEGFSYLNYCTWGLQTNDKCSDFAPRSEDCTSDTCAPY